MTRTRNDVKCGKSGISQGEKCRKGNSQAAALTAGAVGIGALALGAGLLAARRPRARKLNLGSTPPPGNPTAISGPLAPRPGGGGGDIRPVRVTFEQPRLVGSTPRPALPPARVPKSKTQRMRENTRAAMQVAEGRIAQTGREEIRRIAQIGNTMAAAGEATGMAAKTTLRELRLRTEAARRRFEPGYRKAKQPMAKPTPLLPEGGSAFQVPFAPQQPLTPVTIRRKRSA